MKNSLKITIALFLVLSLSSCMDKIKEKIEEKKPDKPEYTTVNKEYYSIQVPDYMTETTQLNDEASLQFMNIYKETYIVIIDESKEEFINVFKELDEYDASIGIIQNYSKIQMNYLQENMQVKKKSEPRSLKINGMDAEIIELTGKVEGAPVDIAYLLAFIEGPENVYFIMTWTTKGRFEKYKNTFSDMIKSFDVTKDTDDYTAENNQ